MDFLAGIACGLILGAVVPAAADVVVHCQPVIRQDCSSNALANHFAFRGQVPNRCKAPA